MTGDTGTAGAAGKSLSGATLRRRLRKAFDWARAQSKTGQVWLDLYAGSHAVGSKLKLVMKSDGVAFDLKDGLHFDLSN